MTLERRKTRNEIGSILPSLLTLHHRDWFRLFCTSLRGYSGLTSADGGSAPNVGTGDEVTRRDSGGSASSSSSRPGSGRVHRPSVAQMMLNREDRKSKRMTASLGSMFVFDTCKPSDLKSAMDEMEAEDAVGGIGGGGAPGDGTFDDSPFADTPIGEATFNFDTFVSPSSSQSSLNVGGGNPSSAVDVMLQDSFGGGSYIPSSSGHSTPHTSSPSLPHHQPASVNSLSSDMSNAQIHDMLSGGADSKSPPPRLPHAPVPLSVQTSLTGMYPNAASSPTRSPSSPLTAQTPHGFGNGPSSPSSSPSAFAPQSAGGFFAPPSQTPPPSASTADEFEYYAAEQLDALIDFLDVGAEMLIEDDQGLTDWLRDDNFAQFEFNPEWLELTLTMKPNASEDSSNGSSGGDIDGDSSDPFAKTNSASSLASRRATVAAQASALPPPPTGLPPVSGGASSLGNTSAFGSGAASVRLPLRGSPPAAVPSPFSDAPLSPFSQVALQDRPRPPSVPDTLPVGVARATNPSPAASNPDSDSSPFSDIPSTTSATGPSGVVPPNFGAPSSFLLPTAIAQGQAPRTGKPLMRNISKQESPSEAAARAKREEEKERKKRQIFASPLISSPGMGESAITVSASIFRVLRMMDPERPFESVMHDSGALTSSDLSIVLSPAIPIPPSAGSNQQSPPSFTVHVSVIAPFWDGIQCLAGLSQGKSTKDILDSLPSASSFSSSVMAPVSGAALISSRTKPNAPAGSSGNGAQNSSPFSSASGGDSTPALNKNNCLTYSEWKGYPSRSATDVQGVPHVLVSTIAIVNDQGRTKRIIKLIALVMTPSDTIPNIPVGTTQLRRPTEPLGGIDPIAGLDPYAASILSAISSAHGTIFVMPPSSRSASIGTASPRPPSAETLSPIDIEDYQQQLKLYQKLNYHAGPIKGNPHVRLLMVGSKDAKLGIATSLPIPSAAPLDPSQQQIAFILDAAVKWAQQQGIGVMKTSSETKWAKKVSELPVPSSAPVSASTWAPHPLLSHLAAQTHALRMEALMTSFDHIQKVKSQTNIGVGGATKVPPQPKASAAKVPLPTPGHSKIASTGSSPDLARMTVAGTSGLSSKLGQNSSPAAAKRASAFGPSPGLSSASNKPLVNKRIIAVIGLTGSGRTSVIRRACHARYSRINAAGGGGGFDPSSTFMMSTLSPMTSTFGATTMNGGTGATSSTSASSFADVFFNTQRCRIEFVETPSRSADKIQFYKDINRAHGFIFVYAGLHPSPTEIAEMHQSMNDVWQAKRQQPLNASTGGASSSSALSRLNALPGSSSSNSSSSVFASSMMRRPSTVNNIPIVILGTQAPQKAASLPLAAPVADDDGFSQHPIASDPTMMSLTQLLGRYTGLAHFAVDTSPVQDPALAKALQWLYNRIGEETLSLKGVRATNRPHHSGSVSGASAPRPTPSSIGSGGLGGSSNSITSIGGFSGNGTPPSSLSPANSRKVLLPGTSSPSSSGRISTIVGNTSGVSVPNDVKGGKNPFAAATSGLQTGLSTSNLQKGAVGANANAASNKDNNSSIAVFMKVEALVVKMRSGVPSPNVSTRPLPPLSICDRRLENGSWLAIAGSSVGASMMGGNSNGGVGSNISNGPNASTTQSLGSSSPSSLMSNSPSMNVEDSSSSSKKKQKILQKCFIGNDAVEWVTNAIVKPEKSSAISGLGASGSYLPSPSQMRTEALGHLQQLLDLSVIRCIWSGGMEETSFSSQSKFQDSHDTIYRFQMDEDNESVLNMRKVWIGEVDHSEIEQLATWLFQKVQPFIVALSRLAVDSSGGYGGSTGASSSSSSTGGSTNASGTPNGIVSANSSGSLLSSGASSDDLGSDAGAMSSPAGTGPRTFVIDGEAFKRSSQFGDLLLFSAKLQRIKVDRLTRPQKLAFWINTYNILSLHVAIQHGYVGKSKSKRKLLYLKSFYQVDGALFSLDDILHGILRGNRKNPNTGKVPFKPNDPRRKLALHDDSTSILSSQVYSNSAGGAALPTASLGSSSKLPPLDPRIFFALTSLSRTSPFISAMRADSLDAQLNALATAYLDAHLELDFKRSSLSLPSSLLAFRSDFSNKAPAPFLTFLATFLEPEKAKNVNFLANKIKEKDIKSRSDDPTPSAPRFR